jgi:hypothetical protein
VLGHSFDQRRRPHGDSDGLLLPNQHDKPLAAGDAGVEQITLRHGVVPRHDRNHYGGYSELTLVDARGVCRHQGVELAKAIGDRAPVEADT